MCKSPSVMKGFFVARIFHELPTVTAGMSVLPGVLGYRTLRRTVQVRLGSNPLRLPGGTLFYAVSRQQFVKYAGFDPGRATSFMAKTLLTDTKMAA